MRIPSLTIFVAAIGVGLWTSRSAVSAPVILGDPPTAPEDVSGLPTGISILSVTGGFSVNANSREQVRSFYNSVYLASDGVPMFTTSDVATCTPGTNSTAFKEAVLRRINWFRAMAGMPAAVTLDPTLNAKDQEAAVIMSRNGALSHHPPTSWSCYT
ncbi:MAG: CAP domain-containing protein, partial [Verrucomicrobia bacterium]|nr:CAP domain-containing protein [Verrucomicrobiota bacterium]